VTGGQPDACSAPYRVRFDEAAPDGLLRTSVLLRYAQDLAWFHSASRGYERAWYAERGLTWLVRAAEIDVLLPIRVGSELVGTTRVVGSRRVWARRRTDFRTADGAIAADVRIDWLLLDRRGSPTRIPPEFGPIFGMHQEPVELARVDLPDPPDDARTTTIAVRPQELDPMDHVNNAVYADWVEEQVFAGGGPTDVRAIPRRLGLEYARAAAAGATVSATTWREPSGRWLCRVAEPDGNDVLRARLSSRP
jgi:acyl-ACP thioesterase